MSQINGCAFCLQYHLNIVRQLGLDLDPRKLDLLAARRDAGLYSEREQAALAWAEALTRVAVHEVDDAVYARASAAFAPAELAHLSAAVANINARNRIAAGFRFAPPPAVRGSTA